MIAHKALNRPLLGFALALLGGLAVAEFLLPASGWAVAVSLVAAISLYARPAPASGRFRASLVLGLGVLSGVALHAGATAQHTDPRDALAHVPNGALLRVRVAVDAGVSPLHPAGSLEGGDGRALGRVPSASLRVVLVAADAGNGWIPTDGLSARLVVGRGIPASRAGDRLQAVVRLVRPEPPGNPGAPSPPALRRLSGVRYLLLAPCAEALRPAAGLAPGPVGLVRRGAERARATIEQRLGEELAARDAGLLAGLMLGDRSAVLESDRRLFERSGTMHILSVSGLHVVLVLAAWAALLMRSGIPRRTRLVTLVVVALCYVAIAGFRTPVTRAAVMAGAALLAGGLGRRLDGWSALATAALALLWFDPMACFRPGWQLSFAAVSALLLAAGPIERTLSAEGGSWRTYVAGLAAASVAATLGTAPLVWLHFGTAAPAALLANLLAVPALALLLIGGLCLLPLLMAGGAAASLAAAMLTAGCGLLRGIVGTFAEMPGGWLVLPPIGAATATALLGGGWWLASGRWRSRPKLTAAGVAVCVGWWLWPAAQPPRTHWVLDVGQGSATLIRTPVGQRILVDAGSSSMPYGGARELRRALAATGTSHIDLLVLSHGDADHINAVEPLVRDFGVSRVWAAPELRERRGGRGLLARLRGLGVPVEVVRDGAVARGLGAGTELRVLHPGPEGRLRGNDGSLVVRYREPGGSMLIPGDIEKDGIADLLARRGAELRSDVLIAPHHGGRNDRLPELLDHVAPRAVVISAGRRFPIDSTLAESHRRELRTLVTAADGAIAIRFLPEFALKSERAPRR